MTTTCSSVSLTRNMTSKMFLVLYRRCTTSERESTGVSLRSSNATDTSMPADHSFPRGPRRPADAARRHRPTVRRTHRRPRPRRHRAVLVGGRRGRPEAPTPGSLSSRRKPQESTRGGRELQISRDRVVVGVEQVCRFHHATRIELIFCPSLPRLGHPTSGDVCVVSGFRENCYTGTRRGEVT